MTHKGKNELQKAPPRKKPTRTTNLPSAFVPGQMPVFFQRIAQEEVGGKIPNAALVYGIGAAILLGVALYFVLSGNWGSGVLMLLPAVALLGYAVHFMRFSS